jgi:hypothetical protein
MLKSTVSVCLFVLGPKLTIQVLVHGNNSELFQKYFGAGPTGPVLGWYDKIATANRAGVLFRCDDPDQNCATQYS